MLAVDASAPPVTTALVHRISRGPTPWWHTSVVCDVTAGVDEAGLDAIASLLPHLAAAGFDAVCVRPSRLEAAWAPRSPLPRFIASAHDCGLRVLVRMTGASLPRLDEPLLASEGEEVLVGRIGSAVAAGADGIDLGSIAPAEDSPLSPVRTAVQRRRVSDLTRRLLSDLAVAERAPILAASVAGGNPSAAGYHLAEDWFHHLRLGSLRRVPWDGGAALDAACAALALHDPAGAVAPWSWLHTPGLTSAGEPGEATIAPGSWEEGADASRRRAMSLFGLSLPGAAYMSYGQFGAGSIETAPSGARASWAGDDESAAAAATLSAALRIRRERAMGSGSMGVLTGLTWAGAGVGVHMTAGVTVVLNASDSPVEVPAEHEPLVSSSPVARTRTGASRVGAHSCAWFDTARVRRVEAAYWD
ncbi:hypothetical protein M3T53_03320 [Actinomyces sp. B33]|uniref:hypothetical protein n=1 Tax=Actinomyces sp. B33 TaxID=2942131 RepID=UPI0023408A76|nr:hypothetical protein [Actinomyces sp. B33]MDC4232747.1 hypothetical protein [Actinomyces sp. B33]